MAVAGPALTSETMDNVPAPPAIPSIPGSGGLAEALPPPLTAVPGFGGYFQMAALPTPLPSRLPT